MWGIPDLIHRVVLISILFLSTILLFVSFINSCNFLSFLSFHFSMRRILEILRRSSYKSCMRVKAIAILRAYFVFHSASVVWFWTERSRKICRDLFFDGSKKCRPFFLSHSSFVSSIMLPSPLHHQLHRHQSIYWIPTLSTLLPWCFRLHDITITSWIVLSPTKISTRENILTHALSSSHMKRTHNLLNEIYSQIAPKTTFWFYWVVAKLTIKQNHKSNALKTKQDNTTNQQ